MEVMVDGVTFEKFPVSAQAFFITDRGFQEAVDVRGEQVARPGAHGDFDLPAFRGARLFTISGAAYAGSVWGLEQMERAFYGILADGSSGDLLVRDAGGVLRSSVRLSGTPRFERVGELDADFQIAFLAADPRKFGESRSFHAQPQILAPGPGGFEDEYSLGSNASIVTSTSDPSGKLIRIVPAVGATSSRYVRGPMLPVVPGTVIPVIFRASWLFETHTTAFTARMEWFDAEGASLSFNSLVYDSGGAWAAINVSETVTVPSGASFARLRFYSDENAGTAGVRVFLNLDVKTIPTAVAHHYGNFPADPVIEVQGPVTAPYTITGLGGRQIVVAQSLTGSQRHTIDFATGGLLRNGVRQLGQVTHYQPWTIPAHQRVAMSIDKGSMTVHVRDTFM